MIRLKKAGKFAKDVLILTISSVVVRIIAIIFNVYISKKMGAEALGVYHMIMSIYLFGINIAVAGLSLTTIKLVSKEEALNNESKIISIMKKIIKYCVVMGVVSCISLILSADFLVSHVLNNMVSKRVIYILALSMPCISVSYSLNGYFTARRKSYISAGLQIFDQISKVIVMYIFINRSAIYSLDNVCIALILGEAICEVVYVLISYWLYKVDKSKLKIDKRLNKGETQSKEIAKVAFPIAFTANIRSGLNTLKQTTIPKALEKSNMTYGKAIAEYGIVTGMAMPIITFMSVFIQPFSSLLLPQFSQYAAKKDKKMIIATIDRVFNVILMYAICIMGGLWGFSKELGVTIYSNASAGWYIKMLCPLVMFTYLDATVDSMLRGLDKQVSVMLCNILDLTVSILFIYIVVPYLGIKGYVASIFLSTILNATISILILIKTVKFDFKIFSWIIIPCVSAAIAVVLVKNIGTFSASGYITLAIKSIIYILIYCIVLNMLKRLKSIVKILKIRI